MEELFEDDTFVLLTPKDKDERDKLVDLINGGGGVVGRVINKKVSILVCSNPSDFEEDVQKAEKLKIPVVRETFIVDSVAKITRLKPEDYFPISTSTSSSSASQTKDEDGDDNGTSAKKQKTDDPVVLVVLVDNTVVSTNSEWMGVCIGNDGATYPFVLTITTRTNDDLEGTIHWPTMGDTLTKIRGSVKSDELKFEEYEAIRGEDNIEIPQNYDAKLTGSSVSGTLTDSQGEKCSFKLNLVAKRSTKAQDLPFLQPKAQFEGTYFEKCAMEVNIISRNTLGDLKGNIYWPTADKTSTSFQGELAADGGLKLNENLLVKGDGVEVPVEYDGKVNGNTIKGKYVATESKTAGDFTLELQKKIKK